MKQVHHLGDPSLVVTPKIVSDVVMAPNDEPDCLHLNIHLRPLHLCALMSAPSGTHCWPGTGIVLLCVRDEQPLKPKRHGTPSGPY